MFTLLIRPEDTVVDCAGEDAPSRHYTELLPQDLVVDVHAADIGAFNQRALGIVPQGKAADEALHVSGLFADLAEHPLSNAIDERRLWEDVGRDMALLASDPNIPDSREVIAITIKPRRVRRPAVLLSALIHTTLIGFMAFYPAASVGGSQGGTGNVIMMRMVAEEEVVPQDPSPGSIDSAASAPAKAKNEERPQEQSPDPVKIEQEIPEPSPEPAKIVAQEKPTEKENGNAPQDSAASLPSTASEERRAIAAAGRQGDVFDAQVISAIREAIFFPKAALNKRNHGEVVVAFAIMKDGSLTDLRVTKPSPFAALNESALQIIEKAARKFPPIPQTVFKDRLDYVVPILFKEKRS